VTASFYGSINDALLQRRVDLAKGHRGRKLAPSARNSAMYDGLGMTRSFWPFKSATLLIALARVVDVAEGDSQTFTT